jgi:hypothetical protein
MDIFGRSLLDCDPFGVIPINNATPPFICALFGNDATATAGVTDDIEACCSPYYKPEYTTGNGCDHHWCGVPAYEAKGTDYYDFYHDANLRCDCRISESQLLLVERGAVESVCYRLSCGRRAG